ncbi:hypothetical protein [Actinosynnema sp. NPDC020468]|uniref:hypothetical protein n=1 Tax=Actinosynnema sp. NPDC020468 TaxID=3154488 RepID=UPI0033C49D21
MTDIRDVLATAFQDEPPLTVDRAAIRRSGRRRRHLRRGLTAAFVLVAVTAVGVPVLRGATAGQDTASPPTTLRLVPSSVQPSGLSPDSAKPFNAAHAAELGRVLAAQPLLPPGLVASPAPGGAPKPFEFKVFPDHYLSFSEVDGPTGRGALRIYVTAAGRDTCDAVHRVDEKPCETKEFEGREVTVFTGGPMLQVWVESGGTSVAVMLDSDRDRRPLTWEELARIATLPGLVVGF